MKFHPLYAGRFAMGLANLRREAPGIIATQSTHKQLASFSQASQIHMQGPAHQRPEAARRASPLQRKLHAARLDLAVLSAVRLARRRRADDEGPLGRGACGTTRSGSASNCARRSAPCAASSRRRSRTRTRRWFFEPFVPRSRRDSRRSRPGAAHDVPGRPSSTDELATNPRTVAARAGRRLARLSRPRARALP